MQNKDHAETCERAVYQKVIMNFQNYTRMMKQHVGRMKAEFERLPNNHKLLLHKRKALFEDIESMTFHNQQIINSIIECASESELGYTVEIIPDIIKLLAKIKKIRQRSRSYRIGHSSLFMT